LVYLKEYNNENVIVQKKYTIIKGLNFSYPSFNF